MELTVLGCGDAFGNGGRLNTSFLLTEKTEHVLIDCGTTTLIRLKQEQIQLENISTIIISHYHGDHFGGLPFLFICMLFEQPRQNPLTITGPQGLVDKVYQLQEIMYPDTASKLDDLPITFVEYDSNSSLDLNGKSLEAYQMNHTPASHPHGFRLTWLDKVFAFSGDTSMTDRLFSLGDGADLFVCECNFMKGVNHGHLSYEEILVMYDGLNCKQLWLSHMNEEVYTSSDMRLNRLSDGKKIVF